MASGSIYQDDAGDTAIVDINVTPLVVAIEMGYGHLRAAWPLADALATEVLEADQLRRNARPEAITGLPQARTPPVWHFTC